MMLRGINSIADKVVLYVGLILIFLVRCDPPLYSQATEKGSNVIHEKSFSEEIFINTDRDIYGAGEKVWLRISKSNRLTHTPVSISKVVYADMLDLENNPAIQLKILIEGSSGSGSFTLPDTLRSGNYILRAYTSWMQNFSKDLFAFKSISVINPFDKISNLKIPQSAVIPDSIVFYPEGGHLLSDFEAQLGIRAFNRNGSPVMINGVIVTDKNDTLCLVRTGDNGYGLVRLKPSGQMRLFLVCLEKGQVRRFALPLVQREGILLIAAGKNERPGSMVTLLFSQDYIKGDKHLSLLIKSSGLAAIRKEFKPGREPDISISGNELPFGISHLSVVDENNRILTDRWISKEYKNPITYKINLSENSFQQRQKIKLDISAEDGRGNPVASDFAVSVAKSVSINRKGKMDADMQMPGISTIREDCNISDINGYLIFFRPHDSPSDRDLTIVNSDPVYLPELEGHLISGTIRERISGEPLRNESITLSFVGKEALCLFTKTDSKGNFNFFTKENGLREIVIQPLNPTRECYVDLNSPFSPGYPDYVHGFFIPDTGRLDEINNLLISSQINNIYEPFILNRQKVPEEPPRFNFYGEPDNSILMSKYIELTSVKEIIAELIPGVATSRNNGKINFRLTKPYQTMPFENGPLVLVDGVPVYDLEKVIGISSRDMEKVDVMIDRYYIAGNVLDGILHFITKKGNLSAMEPDRSVFRMEYDLLQKREFFYSPDYSVDSIRTSHLPDFRNTLYWNPDLHTGKDGKAEIEFYSSDESGEYTISIEGITTDGKTGKAMMPLIIKPRQRE